jgi:hypothetical protein
MPLEAPAVQAMLAELHRLRGAAIGECNSHLRRYSDALGPWRFSRSRLRNWPTGRAMLRRQFLAAWDPAIGKRLPQLLQLNRKLGRSCADWRLLSDRELAAAPVYAGEDRRVDDTAWFPTEFPREEDIK